MLALAGCASVPATGTSAGGPAGPGMSATAAAGTPGDPWEAWNRKVYAFNDAIDNAVLKPVAQTYEKVVPSLVRIGISNVLGNIRDVWSAANQFLQGKGQYGFEMGMRVVTNTFFGLGGVLDPATEMGLVRRQEDFGQTLGRWGLGPGPYMVLPVIGPSSVRDTGGFLVDRQVSPSSLPPTAGGQYSVLAIELVDTRARLLSAGKLLDQVALDRYSFLRDAYLAQRRDAVYDGAPPLETFDEDPGNDPVKPAAAAAAGAKAPASAASAASAASSAAR
jgi:phospholipid-binding lipoprotein MlaA